MYAACPLGGGAPPQPPRLSFDELPAQDSPPEAAAAVLSLSAVFPLGPVCWLTPSPGLSSPVCKWGGCRCWWVRVAGSPDPPTLPGCPGLGPDVGEPQANPFAGRLWACRYLQGLCPARNSSGSTQVAGVSGQEAFQHFTASVVLVCSS